MTPQTRPWVEEKGFADNQRQLRRIWEQSLDGAPSPEGVTLGDLYALPSHKYIFAPTREIWVAERSTGASARSSSARRRTVTRSRSGRRCGLDQNRPVEQTTWAPGEPMLIRDRLIREGGAIERKGVTCFNLYQPPNLKHGDPTKAEPWIAHVKRVYPEDSERIIRWLTHRVQHPRTEDQPRSGAGR